MRTASRVFSWLGAFGLIATVIFAAGSRFRFDNLQGVVVLGAFFLACLYLSRLMRGPGSLELDGLTLPGAEAHGEDEEIHLPGPSWWPAAYGVSGFVLMMGFVFGRGLLVAGAALVVLTTIGWAFESVREYRREVAHHKPVALPPTASIELAQQVLAFRRDHGGADAVVQHVGRGSGEIVLVGHDGAWGNLLARDVPTAREACALADTAVHDGWPSGLGARVVTGPAQWQAMGGDRILSGGDGHAAPRDGTTQVAGRVFLWLGFFALVADVLYALTTKFRYDNLQGVVILTAFAIACYYLHLGLKNAKARPEDAAYAGEDHVTIEPAEPDPPVDLETLHLPGPSWWPAFFSVAGFVVVLGLVFHSAVWIAAGIVLIVICCVGWGVQSVHEYRQAISGQHHGTQDALHAAPSPLSH